MGDRKAPTPIDKNQVRPPPPPAPPAKRGHMITEEQLTKLIEIRKA